MLRSMRFVRSEWGAWRLVGVLVYFLWALFWTAFGLLSGIGEGLGALGVLMHMAVPGLLFLAVAVAATYWPRIGGGLLFGVGLMVMVGYPLLAGDNVGLATIVVVLLMMAVPPLAAGALLLIDEQGRLQPPV